MNRAIGLVIGIVTTLAGAAGQRDLEAGPGVSTVTTPAVRTNAIPTRPAAPRAASAPASGAGG